MEYRSFTDLHETIVANIEKIPRDIDLVVGVPRSGLLAANIIALLRNLPLADFDGFLQGRLLSSGRRLNLDEKFLEQQKLKVLLVDDSLQSGTQLENLRKALVSAGLSHEITFCVVYVSLGGVDKIDIAMEIISRERVFEWNIFHHPRLINSCIDIDGFLCEDPTPEQNDDGDNYLDFLKNAKPCHVPTVPLGWLVTCRLEKYRPPTEAWLKKYGIRYKQLFMMDFPSKEARIASGGHAVFKSNVYLQTGACLFIESSLRQSREIVERTSKFVFCVETMSMLKPDIFADEQQTIIADALRQGGVWSRILGGLTGKKQK